MTRAREDESGARRVPSKKPTELWAGDALLRETHTRRRRADGTCPNCGTPTGTLPFCLRDATLLDPGFVLAERYTLEESLGSGGSALVFGARHKLLGKPVAIKFLRKELANDTTHAQRFMREARLAGQLRHENVVGVLDFGNSDALGLPFLVMERLYGSTLAEEMKRTGPMPVTRALPILQQLARALTSAHAQGIVHRDLTPRNVVLEQSSGRRDFAKLCDFGLSRLAVGGERITVTGQMLGTPAYAAPEQVRGDATQDGRIDLYSFGVIAYEMLTGALPHDGSTPVALLASKLQDEPRALRAVKPELECTDALESLIMRCLAREPEDRPATAAEVETALASIAAGAQVDRTVDLVGRKAGNYDVVSLLGTGGVGSVYKAVHPLLGTTVAIKVLLPEVAAWPEVVERFIQEARASTAIGSPHICRYQDFGTLADGRAFAVMEYYDGETLESLVRREGALPIERAAAIIRQIAAAMRDAHAAGIIHRDLKPENIFLAREKDGRESVKVLDFGIAKVMAGSSKRTQAGFFLGTPAYCAPEQIQSLEIGPAADVYALGATAFELVTGRIPFEGSPEEIFALKRNERAPDPRLFVPGLSDAAAKTIMAMLAADPNDRPATMDDVRAEVAAWTPEADAPEAARPRRFHLASAWGIALVAGLALLGGGATALWLMPSRNAESGPVTASTDAATPAAAAPTPSVAPAAAVPAPETAPVPRVEPVAASSIPDPQPARARIAPRPVAKRTTTRAPRQPAASTPAPSPTARPVRPAHAPARTTPIFVDPF